eukprot:2914971-Pleurochrysis_carterae.AAC.1
MRKAFAPTSVAVAEAAMAAPASAAASAAMMATALAVTVATTTTAMAAPTIAVRGIGALDLDCDDASLVHRNPALWTIRMWCAIHRSHVPQTLSRGQRGTKKAHDPFRDPSLELPMDLKSWGHGKLNRVRS